MLWNSSGMERCQVRRTFWRHQESDPRLPPALAEALWIAPDRLFGDGKLLKIDRRTTVARIEHGGAAYILKRYNLCGPLHTVRHLPLVTRARRNWRYGRRLRSIGAATPWPLAYREECLGPLRTRSFLLTEYIPGIPLVELLLVCGVAPRECEHLASQFVELWRRLGMLRLSHGDLKATNLLVTRDGRLWLIDLDGMRSHWLSLTFRWSQRRDWLRFLQNWDRVPHIAAVFRAAMGGEASHGVGRMLQRRKQAA